MKDTEKSSTCSVTVKTSIPTDCLATYENTVKSILFNPETGEVMNEFGELIGTGVWDGGILKVTSNPK